MKAPNTLMIQGTTSDAGKSTLVTALCRILVNHGLCAAPFKPQNMALNSAVTPCGGEIGRAQAVQAHAAKIPPTVDMNPVLLKPNSDIGAQVIVLGKVLGNSDAVDYHQMKPTLLQHVLDAHQRLAMQYDAVIVEGAGSPAEINLRDRDIANMGFAEAIDCKVVIVADIDKGGVFAHLVGTYELLSDSEKKRVAGFVINKFRGDYQLLKPGIEWLEKRLGVPVLATIPYVPQLHIEAEDAIAFTQVTDEKKHIHVTVIAYPRMSNHTDFDVLRLHPNIKLSFARTPNEAPVKCDLLVLPGSKSVIPDLNYVFEHKWEHVIKRHLRYGGKVFAICGGLQMLGKTIKDPLNIESNIILKQGLNLMPYETELANQKQLSLTQGHAIKGEYGISGYEIHSGKTIPLTPLKSLFICDGQLEGYESDDGAIRATYLHGIFDNTRFLTDLFVWLGLRHTETFDYQQFRESEIERLATEVEKYWPAENIKQLVHC